MRRHRAHIHAAGKAHLGAFCHKPGAHSTLLEAAFLLQPEQIIFAYNAERRRNVLLGRRTLKRLCNLLYCLLGQVLPVGLAWRGFAFRDSTGKIVGQK